MGHTLKLLGGTLLFLLEIDDLALVQHLPAVALVVFGNGAVTDAKLLAYLLERIAFAGVDIIVFVLGVISLEFNMVNNSSNLAVFIFSWNKQALNLIFKGFSFESSIS